MTAPGTDWRKAGRDAAHEDAACEGADPCTTLDAARVRCAAWLEDVEGADVEAAAAGYLAGWAAHLRDADDTGALDLDAIEARANAASGGPWAHDACQGRSAVISGTPVGVIVGWRGDARAFDDAEFIAHARQDVLDLAAEVRRLRALHDATAQAFDDLVARVWAATGETHEPPADVEALVARVVTARREGAEAMREECVARVMESARAGVHRRSDAGDAVAEECSDLADALRALPLPEGSDASPRVAAYRAGAEAMRDALVSALAAMAHAEATEAELFRLTRDEDSAAEHHHKRAVLLETRVTALSLQLPEVTP